MPAVTALRAVVTGMVQGVGFRFAAARAAREAGVVGWVRNLADGGVETFAQGPAEALSAYRRWLDHGPPGAVVVRVIEQAGEPDPGLRRFEIR